MTCSQDSFLLEIPRRHISKCFPLVFSLAKPLQLPTRASGWSVTASPQRPEQWEEEPLVLSPHPLQKKGPGGSHQMSDICKELLLILQLGSCNSLHGWTTALVSRYSKTQHRSWKFSYGQKKAESCCWVWLKVLGWSIHKTPSLWCIRQSLAVASVLAAAIKATIPILPSGHRYQRRFFSSSFRVATLLLCLAQWQSGENQ